MKAQTKQAAVPEAVAPLDLLAHDVRRIAVDWSWKHLPDRLCPADPEFNEQRQLWRVPIVLSYPGICLGEVGEVWLDAAGAITAHTEIADIEAHALQLGRKNRAKIRAAFLRTRTA